MASTAYINQIINSIIQFPVSVDSDSFAELKELQKNGDITESNASLANRAFVYCYLCEALDSSQDLHVKYLTCAKEIIDQNNLLEVIVSDIVTKYQNFCHVYCAHDENDFKNACPAATAEQVEVAKKNAQVSLGIYMLYVNSEKQLCGKAFKTAYIFLHYISLGVVNGLNSEFIHNILTNENFHDLFFKKRIKKTLRNQRALARSNLQFVRYIYNFSNVQHAKTSLNKTIKGMAGYWIILYKSEEYRMTSKKLQEILNDKKELPLHHRLARWVDKYLSSDICSFFSAVKEENKKIERLRLQICNIENDINQILSDNDIRQYLKFTYKMNADSPCVKSLADRSDLLFYKTGSTSIILRFTYNNAPTVLKLVKPCFFSNERIQNATKSLKEYYGSIKDALRVHESCAKYAIMDFIEGNTITEFTALSNSEYDRRQYLTNVKCIVSEIISTLEELHSRDHFHKDLSKDNIIITSSGMKPKFIDFGQNYVIADVSSADQYADISISIAPEVLSCSVKLEYDFIWSDLYSLGIIVLELYNNKIAKDKNVLATLLDETWKTSPSLAYLIELLIDERVENRKAICDILNSDFHLLKNLLPSKIYMDKDISNKKVVTFVSHKPGNERSDRSKVVDNFSGELVGLHFFLKRCLEEILTGEILSLKAGKEIDRGLIAKICFEFSDFIQKNAKVSVKAVFANFVLVFPLFLSILFSKLFPNFFRKFCPQRVFIKDYCSFFQKLNSLSWMIVWFVGVGFFAKFFHDLINDRALLSSLATKWFNASENFCSFLPGFSKQIAKQVEFVPPHGFSGTGKSSIIAYLVNVVDGLYNSYFHFIYDYYTPEVWDIVLSALIVGTTFVMCATPYYKIIFSKIVFLDFCKITSFSEDVPQLSGLERNISKLKAYASEAFVRSTSCIHAVPILIGLCNPTYWATCSWIGVIPVTINSFINTKYLKQSYRVYTDQAYFMLPISNAVKETVDKFSYWHVLLIAYIVVLLVGDFGLRGNIIQDWLMYSFLVAVVNVVKMQFFNCYKEGPGIHSTIYRCYAASLRSKYITKSQN